MPPNRINGTNITPNPATIASSTFLDDLLDFKWGQIKGKQVEVVVVQELLNFLPRELFKAPVVVSKANNTYQMDNGLRPYTLKSNTIIVDVDSLKKYKKDLLIRRKILFSNAEKAK